MKTAIIFSLAILTEVIATTSLRFSQGFTKLVPSLVVVAGYGISFYLFALTLKVLPVGLSYAIWSGVGTVLTVFAGVLLWNERLDLARAVGILLVIAGIVLINLYSNVTAP